MCSPVFLAVTGLVTGAVGAGLSAYGQYRQVQAQNQAINYNAAILRQNAIVREQQAVTVEAQAEDALQRGEIAEKQQRLRTVRRIGEQRAAIAGAGVSVGSGSAIDLIADTEYFGELDALDVRRNAQLEAHGFNTRASDIRNQAQDLRNQANLSTFGRRSPALAATTSVLTSASPLISNFSTFGRKF
jgi:hypothetical protein